MKIYISNLAMTIIQRYKLIFVFSLITLYPAFCSTAQTIDYEDLYNSLGNLSPQQSYFRLFLYQNQNPHFSNTYVQLGNASEKVLKQFDPLRNFEQVNFWVSNAVLYYSLFPVYLQENEVRRNREYYANLPIIPIGSKIENEDVLSYVQKRSAYCNGYKDSVSLIYKALEKSKDHYNNSVRIFNKLNETYDNLNELLLQTDNALLSDLQSLENEFNQSIRSFNEYKLLIRDYPISGYNQKYKLKKIETYRLDGLTNSDFLKDSFELWDYGDWINYFYGAYNGEIIPLRHEITSIQKLFSDNFRKLSWTEVINPDDKYSSYDDLFMFRLGKFDNNSLVRELFRYLNGRQDFLILSKLPLNSPADSASALMNRKLRYFHRVALQLASTENLLQTYREAINPERVKRFWEFFEKEYGGLSGLVNFYDQEKVFLSQTMSSNLKNLKTYLQNEKASQTQRGNAFGSKGVAIPLYSVQPGVEGNKSLTYVSQSVHEDQGEPQYASGFIQRQGQVPLAFTAKISSEHKVEWVREVGIKTKSLTPTGNSANFISGFDGGCMVLISGKDANDYNISTIARFDDKGKDVFSKQFNLFDIPVFFQYDDINQLSIIGFAAQKLDTLNNYSSFTLCRTDSVGNIQWKTSLDIQGQLVDVIQAEKKYLAFFNYKEFTVNGNRVVAGSGYNHTGHVMIELSESGDFIGYTPFNSSQSFSIDRVFSVSNDEINLIGYENSSGENNLIYAIITSQGKVIYKNFPD